MHIVLSVSKYGCTIHTYRTVECRYIYFRYEYTKGKRWKGQVFSIDYHPQAEWKSTLNVEYKAFEIKTFRFSEVRENYVLSEQDFYGFFFNNLFS